MKLYCISRSKSRVGLSSESGATLIEFAICVSFLFITIFGIVDYSILILNYMKLEQSVREAVRTASKLPITEIHPVQPQDTWYIDVDTGPNRTSCSLPVQPDWETTGISCGHVLLQARVRRVIHHQTLFGVDFLRGDMEIRSRLNPIVLSAISEAAHDTIDVELNGTFRGFFGSYNMQVAYRGPYLYQYIVP